eukprot:Em0001g3128a
MRKMGMVVKLATAEVMAGMGVRTMFAVMVDRDTSGGEGDADDGGSSNGDENDRGDGDSSDCGQRYGGSRISNLVDGGTIDGDESDTGNSNGDESDVGEAKRCKQEVCSGSDIVPNAHGNSGRAPQNALSRLDKLTVVRFITNYATVHTLPDPSRLPGQTRDFVLENSHTMKSLYGENCKAVEVQSRRALPATQQPCPYRLTSQLQRQYTLLKMPTPDQVPPVPHKMRQSMQARGQGGVQPHACLLPPAWTGREECNHTGLQLYRGEQKHHHAVVPGLEDRIQLNFKLPGHTNYYQVSARLLFWSVQEALQMTGPHRRHGRPCRVCMSGKDVECVPQLYQRWDYYNWNAFLGRWFEPLSAFGHSHTFEFDREHPSVMEMRAMPADTNPTKVNNLRRGVKVEDIGNAFQSQVIPPVIKPKGLSLQQSQYLFDKVREYVHGPTKRDNMCPKPQGVTAASSAGGTSQQSGNSELPRSSAAIPNPPTGGGGPCPHARGFMCDNSCYRSLRRKHRSRSELIYAYKCLECGIEYASYPALYLHRKRNHHCATAFNVHMNTSTILICIWLVMDQVMSQVMDQVVSQVMDQVVSQVMDQVVSQGMD